MKRFNSYESEAEPILGDTAHELAFGGRGGGGGREDSDFFDGVAGSGEVGCANGLISDLFGSRPVNVIIT